MKVVTIRFKKGIKKKIRQTQKTYEYMCPLNDIKLGEYVLLEVKIHNREDFQVGRIESVMDLEEYDDGKKQLPYGFVVCRLPVKKFRERCHHIRLLKKKTRRQNKMRSIDMKNNE